MNGRVGVRRGSRVREGWNVEGRRTVEARSAKGEERILEGLNEYRKMAGR